MNPHLLPALRASLELSSALLSARNATDPATAPDLHAALESLERRALAVYAELDQMVSDSRDARKTTLHDAVESSDPYAVFKWWNTIADR